jgi:protein TonB
MMPPPAMTPPALADTALSVDPPPSIAPPEVPKVRPQARPAKPQTSQPAQRAARAAGSGNTAQAGDGGAAPLATLSQGARADLQASWGASIRARIERRKAYPAAAGRATGTVTVRLTVSPSGRLGGVTVVQSSGNSALDQAALRAVGSARLPKAPQGLTDASYAFTLPMTFAR